jgi:hypothetical protein
VERAQKTTIKLGGRVLAAPGKFPNRGEQAVFTDPDGALFGVVRSSSGDPEDFRAEPGDFLEQRIGIETASAGNLLETGFTSNSSVCSITDRT